MNERLQLMWNEIRALRARVYGADWASTGDIDALASELVTDYSTDIEQLHKRVSDLEADIIALHSPVQKVSE